MASYSAAAYIEDMYAHCNSRTYLLDIGQVEQFSKDEYTGRGSGVLDELSCGCTLRGLRHQEERLQLGDMLRSNLHFGQVYRSRCAVLVVVVESEDGGAGQISPASTAP